MFISEVKLMQRKNLGNYEHKELTVAVSLVEGDSEVEALEKAQKLIDLTLEGKVEAPVKEEAPKEPTKKKVAKKKVAKKVTKKAAEPVVVPTLEEMMELCRETATRLKSGDKIKALIKEVCKVDKLTDADASTYLELQKKLQDA